MARIVGTPDKNGRLALANEDGDIIAYGHLEIPYVPPGPGGAILGDVQFIMEPRSADRTNEEMMLEAHRGV